MTRRHRRAIGADTSGAATIELALIAPFLLVLLLGVFQIGLYAHNYNAVRSVVADVSRYAVVEYQKENSLTLSEIRSTLYARALTAPYGLNGDNLDVEVTEAVSEIGDARKFNITVHYAPEDLMGSLGRGLLTLSYARPVYVRKTSIIP